MASQAPLSGQIADLSQRVAACEAQLGASSSGAEASKESVRSRVTALTRRVDDIFQHEKTFVDYERNVDALEGWLRVEHASASHVLFHNNAKLNYVVQHAEQLQEFSKSLRQVESLEQYINPPVMQELPKYSEQLRRIEANSAVAVGGAMKLHDDVARLAEDYHKTMMAINAQLLEWDSKLASKQ
mmetsp:Transcript_100541/g.224641  ORF Transcript_100541/g.224641 Transcript_100541/m.224641 type:complete len:185 (+) Transcript_100541:70-624(+)